MARKKTVENTKTRIRKDDDDRIKLIQVKSEIKTKIATITHVLDVYENNITINIDRLAPFAMNVEMNDVDKEALKQKVIDYLKNAQLCIIKKVDNEKTNDSLDDE